MIYIYQADQMGSTSLKTKSRTNKDFVEMYYLTTPDWREKALQDCCQAFAGVLSAEDYI